MVKERERERACLSLSQHQHRAVEQSRQSEEGVVDIAEDDYAIPIDVRRGRHKVKQLKEREREGGRTMDDSMTQ